MNPFFKINYFGLIQQSTGEDWNDTKLSLSTAVPSIGGNVPILETQNVRLKQDKIRVYTKSKKKASCFGCRRSSKKYYEQKENFIESDIPLECECEIKISNLTTQVNIKQKL